MCKPKLKAAGAPACCSSNSPLLYFSTEFHTLHYKSSMQKGNSTEWFIIEVNTYWPALVVQEDRTAALTQGLTDWRQAEGGGEGVRVRPHGAVSTHFVRQLTGTLVQLLSSWRQLLPRLWWGICPNLSRQALALQGGAAGNVPLLILIFLLGCWGTRAWAAIESLFQQEGEMK